MSLLLCLWIAAPIGAAADAKFVQLRSAAEPLGSLSAFLERYVGACGPGSPPQCKSNANAFRSRSNGRRYFLVAGDESSGVLSAGRFDEARREYELRLTPFFAAGPYALTHGAPRQTDAAGNPLMPLISMRRKAPQEWDAARLPRMISARELRIELVFTPQDSWTLPRKKSGPIQGVKSRIDAVQVVSGRTGEVIASWP